MVAEEEAAKGPRAAAAGAGRFESSGTPSWPLVGSCSSSLLLPLMVSTTAAVGQQGMQSSAANNILRMQAGKGGVASVSVAVVVVSLVGCVQNDER